MPALGERIVAGRGNGQCGGANLPFRRIEPRWVQPRELPFDNMGSPSANALELHELRNSEHEAPGGGPFSPVVVMLRKRFRPRAVYRKRSVGRRPSDRR